MMSVEDRAEAKKLVGYCEDCDEYTHFVRSVDPEKCGSCGGKFSSQQGRQLITQRTFNATKSAKKGRVKNVSS